MDIQRYALYISEYTDSLEHISGISNTTADMLSRYYHQSPEDILTINEYPLNITQIKQTARRYRMPKHKRSHIQWQYIIYSSKRHSLLFQKTNLYSTTNATPIYETNTF